MLLQRHEHLRIEDQASPSSKSFGQKQGIQPAFRWLLLEQCQLERTVTCGNQVDNVKSLRQKWKEKSTQDSEPVWGRLNGHRPQSTRQLEKPGFCSEEHLSEGLRCPEAGEDRLHCAQGLGEHRMFDCIKY